MTRGFCFRPLLGGLVLLLASVLPATAIAADESSLYDRSRALETEAFGLLLEHFNFEEALLAPDNDRLTVFVSVPYGARMVLDQITLHFNGKPVYAHKYTVGELARFLNQATQQVFMTRIPQGQHTLRLDLRVVQGEVRQMKTHTFTKGKSAKYIDLQIAGDPVREVVPVEW